MPRKAQKPSRKNSKRKKPTRTKRISKVRSKKSSSLGRMEFPYMKDSHGHYAPLVYLQAWTGNRWLYLQAYVDSGASWSIFHLDVAQLLGIKLNETKRRKVKLGNGSIIPVYVQKIKVRFAGQEFSAPIGFSDLLDTGFNLIGRAGFFDQFSVCFNDRRRVLTVTNLTRSRR